MEESNIGEVYLYESIFLRRETDSKHFHPVVLDILFGRDGRKKGVVIITTYDEQKWNDLKIYGEHSLVRIGPGDYDRLRRASMISCRIYEEDERNLKREDRQGKVSDALVDKIKEAAKHHRHNSEEIKRLL